ncbi:MAG TPA: NUDIX domain-containing protein [Jatrophihabitans sp.]
MIEVVAAALIVDGTVLAARRHTPPGWEFPGGKIEPGETPEQALRRECHEELGIDVQPAELLGRATAPGIVLRLYRAETADEPAARADHLELRRVGADDLDALDWLPVDRALLIAVRPALR